MFLFFPSKTFFELGRAQLPNALGQLETIPDKASNYKYTYPAVSDSAVTEP